MLKNLMKYDLLRTGKYTAYFAAGAVLFTLLTRALSGAGAGSFAGRGLAAVRLVIAVTLIVGLWLNAFLRFAFGFRESCYKDPSYLTHTLPVARGTVYTARFLSGAVNLLVSLAVLLLCVGLLLSAYDAAKPVLDTFLKRENAPTLALFLLAVALQAAALLTAILAGIVLGHKGENNRVLISVLLVFGIYYAMQGLSLGVTALTGLFIPEVRAFFTATDMTADLVQGFGSGALRTLLLAVCAGYLPGIVAVFLLGRHAFKKGVNVE